ncbi:MAG: hypothetical protein PUC23_03590 [bacterium]|nr:hypothetical protein [bacterium]
MSYYMYETIRCPFCGENHAHITYEESRVYQLNCTECHNAIFHQDSSMDNAVKFFKNLFIIKDNIIDKWNDVGLVNPILSEDLKKILEHFKICSDNK